MIPSPRTYNCEQGAFRFSQFACITCVTDTVPSQFLAKHLQKRLQQRTGVKATVSTNSKGASGRIEIRLLDQPTHGSESYDICVSADGVTITGAYAGLLYGAEALCQLIRREGDTWYWPCQKTEDSPAMPWRGLMLDCSRHFLSKQFLLATELMWRDPAGRDYDSFLTEVLDAEAYWNSIGVNYGPYTRNETMPAMNKYAFSDYFENEVLRKRPYLKKEW